MELSDAPRVEFLILADYAEVIAGKLYVVGGAWDRIAVRDTSQPMRFGVAVGVLVPWNATNQSNVLNVTIEDLDGHQHATLLQSNFITGRPPELKPGATQRVVMAMNALLAPPPAGEYALVASIDGEERHRVAFTVIQAPTPPA